MTKEFFKELYQDRKLVTFVDEQFANAVTNEPVA